VNTSIGEASGLFSASNPIKSGISILPEEFLLKLSLCFLKDAFLFYYFGVGIS
jgi:hypothetical protein